MCKRPKKQTPVKTAFLICDCNSSMQYNVQIPVKPRILHCGGTFPLAEPRYFMVPTHGKKSMRHGEHSYKCCRNKYGVCDSCYFSQSDSENDQNYRVEEYERSKVRVLPYHCSKPNQKRLKMREDKMEYSLNQNNESSNIDYDLIFERIDMWGEITFNLIEKLSKNLQTKNASICAQMN